MLSNKLALAALALVGMVGAAGAGAYIASRQSAPVDKPAPVATAPSTTPAASGAVEATEAVMDDSASAPGSSGATADKAAPGSGSTSAPSAATANKTPDKAGAATPGISASASVRSGATTDKTVAKPVAPKKSPRPADRPVASREHQNSAPVTQTARNEHQAATVDAHPARPEPSQSSETHPIDTDRTARADRATVEPTSPPPPPAPQFVEVTVPADSVIGLQIETALSSETAHVEDRVSARVTRDVRADGRVAIPAGSRVLGSVSVVDRGGKMKEQARLGVRFHTVILADGTELPLQTETVLREGESPAQASAAKVGGGAIGGAILGAILGGGKGAAIGGAVGAAGGTTAVMAGGRKPAQIAAGSPVTVKVLSPVTVTVEKE